MMTNKPSKILIMLFTMAFLAACSSDQEPLPDATIDATVWTGPTVTFRKAPGSSPTEAANQDRITDLIWITRANSGGQIYNANMLEHQGSDPRYYQHCIGNN